MMSSLRRAMRIGVACLLCLTQKALAQVNFEVPEQLTFAGQTLHLDERARAVVRKHGSALIVNPKFYRAMTERADGYFPLIERVFAQEGLPDDFKYLCIQESGLTSDVVSTSKAVGYWQFKAETAVEQGLRVDNQIDERLNILSSSRGAAKYLIKNNGVLNNWTYTLLSFYAGLGGTKLIADPAQFGAASMQLDSNTHFYILKFLAHKVAFESAVNRSPNPALQVMEYGECEGKTLRQIAEETNVELPQIEFYNKWCRTGMVPTDKDYSVMIPVKGAERPSWMAMTTRPTPQLGDNLKPWRERKFFGLIEGDAPPVSTDNAQLPVFFSWNGIKAILARKQDNINKLALAAGLDKAEMMDYNDLRIFDLIVPGQVYYVKPKRKKARVPFHTVRQGESLWEVAQSYGITLKALMRKNKMSSPERLVAGRILWLRHSRPDDQPVEYDPAVKGQTLPITKPITAAPPVVASVSPAPIAVVTSSDAKTNAAQPTAEEVAVKYENVSVGETPEEAASTVSGSPVTTGTNGAPAPAQVKIPAQQADKLKPAPPAAPATHAEQVSATKTAAKADVPATEIVSLGEVRIHLVQAKETVYGIGKYYGVSTAQLTSWNPDLGAGLKIGTELRIPVSAIKNKAVPASTPAAVNAAAINETAETAKPAAAPTPAANEYSVKPGDTFYAIAKANNLTVDQLKSLNNKADTAIKPGDMLRIK